MNRFRLLSIAILFIVVSSLLPLSFTGTAQADSEKGNLKELTDGADSIVVGTVVERSSYWNDEHNRIYTSVVMSVEDRLKGTLNQDRVAITIPGGEVEGIGELVSEMPSFDQGEKAVVFLKKLPQTQLPEEQFEVYGGFRGKFPIKGDKVDNLPVTEFRGRINSILAGQPLPEDEMYAPLSTATLPYSYSGYCWPHPPAPVVSYRINENTADCSGEGAAVQAAAATWSVPANFSLTYAGTTTATGYSLNGVNEICWRDFGTGGTIAITYYWYYTENLNLVECDMELNDYYSWSTADSCPTGYFDVQTVSLHEFGHFLLLDDLYGSGDTAKVMYGYGYSGTTKRALTADDIAGIKSIYALAPLSITTTTLPDGERGVAYSQTLQATGGTGSYTWSITVGTLPDGLILTPSTGVIAGTPTTVATSSFTAQVNDGSTTATQPLSINVTVPLQKLIGADDATAAGPVGGGYLVLDRFAAVATGNVTRIRAKCTASGSVKVALYTDSTGSPGTLINANNTGAIVSAGWNNISLPSTAVTSDTYYWIAYISSANCVGYNSYTGGGLVFRPYSYTVDFPASAGTGFITSSGNHSLTAGWGTVTPPALPDIPLLLSPGTAITFKWGASTGATTYWLQVNTASDFSGTNAYNAEVGNVTTQEVTGLSLGTAYYWRVKAGNSGGWSAWSSVRSVVSTLVP